jgi:hypothetical protein
MHWEVKDYEHFPAPIEELSDVFDCEDILIEAIQRGIDEHS